MVRLQGPLVLAVLITSAWGQLPLRYDIRSTLVTSRLGEQVAILGDTNGDGRAEFLTKRKVSVINGIQGQIDLRSGADGSIIESLIGAQLGERIISMGVLGDVDGDGVSDFGYVTSGFVRWISGFDRSTIRSIPNSAACMGIGDINGDGVPDALGGSLAGYLEVRSGADGSLLLTVQRPPAAPCQLVPCFPAQWGTAVAALGDTNADGVPDLAVSAPWDYDPTKPTEYGRVFIYSGNDGSLLQTMAGTLFTTSNGSFSTEFGASIAGIGDLDGDGAGDLVIGAPRDPRSGAVAVHSGATGALILEVTGSSTPLPAGEFGTQFGAVVSAAGDANGDGIPDFAATAPWELLNGASKGAVRVYSGLDGSLLLERFGTHPNETFQAQLAGGGDLDGDGMDDIVVGRPLDKFNGLNCGGFEVLSACGARRYDSSAGTPTGLSLDWVPGGGPDKASGYVVGSGAQPGAIGFVGLSLDLADTTASGLPLLIDVTPSHLLFVDVFAYDANGIHYYPVSLRHPLVVPFNVRAQFFQVSPLAASNGLETRLNR